MFGDYSIRRRDILRAGAVSTMGLDLPCWFHLNQVARQLNAAEVTSRPRAKACIFLFMWGGPAHQDTWDMKPNAPLEYRGEFQPIQTNVPELQICEHLPMLAKRADKLAVIRSMTHDDVDHTSATHYPLTGKATPRRGASLAEDWPSIGSVVAQLGMGRGPLPPFVSMMPVVPQPDGAPRFVESSHGQGAGWLSPTYQPMRIDADGSKPDYSVGDFTMNADVPELRSSSRRHLLETIDGRLDYLNGESPIVARTSNYERAYSLLSSRGAVEAFDLSREPMKVRERYGMNIHGQSVLQARRLVEAGVPFVTVFWPNDGKTNVSVYWDTHNRNFIDLKTRLCPVTDLAFTALLDDLDQRGMLDETLIVWTGEMGRTPRVGQGVVGGAGAGRDGRDHWPSCFTTVMAGGGIRGGVIHGSSDKFAAYPASYPTAPHDLAATIYHCLGVPPHLQLKDHLGRPFTICEGSPIEQILV